MMESDLERRERLAFENECKRLFIRVTGRVARRLDLPGITVAYRPLDVGAAIRANERLIRHIDDKLSRKRETSALVGI